MLSLTFVVPQIDAPSHCERFGALVVVVGLTGSEFASVSAIVAVVKAELRDDKWVPYVSDCVAQIDFFYF